MSLNVCLPEESFTRYIGALFQCCFRLALLRLAYGFSFVDGQSPKLGCVVCEPPFYLSVSFGLISVLTDMRVVKYRRVCSVFSGLFLG